MTYSVKELYLTRQGEGVQTGRPAVFLRFAGCNLWSGREADRDSAVCRFCDTEFVGTDGPGGGTFATAAELAAAVSACWACGPYVMENDAPYVVCTGGEPALQLDGALIDALHSCGFEIGIETNGTRTLPAGLDWICVSPKAGAPLVQTEGDELKLVYPQEALPPERLLGLAFRHYLLQPMDGPALAENEAAARAYCRTNPAWRLSRQLHKVWGIP